MTDKEHKQAILDASVVILQEYKNRTHHSSLTSCELCKRFYNSLRNARCGDCPMALFEIDKRLRKGCAVRKCSMVNQHSNLVTTATPSLKETKRVIEFYEEFIKLVKSSRHCRLKTKSGNTSLFARRLMILDTNIFLKHERQ